jgi:hypothetical protein
MGLPVPHNNAIAVDSSCHFPMIQDDLAQRPYRFSVDQDLHLGYELVVH